MSKVSGLYFIVDLSYRVEKVPDIVRSAIKGGVDAVQLWNSHASPSSSVYRELRKITRDYSIPLLVNNEIEVAMKFDLDGVHLDFYDKEPKEIKSRFGNCFLVGYTIGNNIERALWAQEAGADYISFCSVFRSKSVMDCEIVPLQTLKDAKKRLSIQVFASGGINFQNARKVLQTGVDGIAVISAIQRSRDPERAAKKLKHLILTCKTRN